MFVPLIGVIEKKKNAFSLILIFQRLRLPLTPIFEWFLCRKSNVKRSANRGPCSAESNISGTPMHKANYSVESLREEGQELIGKG